MPYYEFAAFGIENNDDTNTQGTITINNIAAIH